MSVLPSTTANCMASAVRSPAPERETFQNFFECWLVEQNQHLQELIAASQQHHSTADDDSLCSLIKRVLENYEHYYKAKARWGKEDVLAMLSPAWTSTFKVAFLWIGGWRPIMAFHLLYFKSGLQLEDQLNELIRGMGRGDLGDLSPCQLSRIDELQAKTIKEEKEVTEKMAKHQETVADSSMLELNHLVSGNDEERGWGRCGSGEGESAMECKEEGLKEMLQRADDLRLRTLKAVIDILTPIQAVHFLIAAAPKDS